MIGSLKLVPAWNKLWTKIGELLLKEEPRTLTTSLSSVLTTFSRIMTVGLRNLKDSWFYLIKSPFYSVRLGATNYLSWKLKAKSKLKNEVRLMVVG